MKRPQAILLLLLLTSTVSAQVYSTQGTDFWLAFLNNNDAASSYSLVVSAKRSCTVVVTSTEGTSLTYTANANQALNIALNSSNCFQSGSCVITSKSFHITATDTVSVSAYCRNQSAGSCDATTLIATPSLGGHYFVQNYPVVNSTHARTKAVFNVLATEDSTLVKIKFTGNTSTSLHAGDSTTVMLMQGQVYQVEGNPSNSDFSGTEVCSQNCRPIAVFAGNAIVTIPSGSNVAYDHVLQQMAPTYSADNDWILVPAEGYSHTDFTLQDYVRVTATSDNTQIYKNGAPLSTINRGQTHEFNIDAVAHITTSKPAMLYQYMASRHVSQQGRDRGDAAMFAPNPLRMTTRDVTFRPDSVASRDMTSLYYVNLVVPSTDTIMLSIDGTAVAGFTPISGTNYSYKRLPITSASHHITTIGSGFIGSCYSIGENWEGVYKTLGGTATYAVHITDTIDTTTCDPIFTYMGVGYAVPSTNILNQGCIGDIILLRVSKAGDTLVTMPTIDTTLCGNSFEWHGGIYTENGDFTYYQHLENGCDSIFNLSLTLLQPVELTAKVSACKPYVTFNDSIFYEDGEHLMRYPAQTGCDTMLHLDVTLYPDYDTLYIVEIADSESYTWINGVTYTDNAYAELVARNQHGCDSIHRLVLLVSCSGNTPEPTNIVPNIWVPNVFTPNADNNQQFGIKSKNIDHMTVSIYRRWGERVCTFDGLTEQWDGTKNGIPCPQEAYVYIIHYHVLGSNERPEPIVGTVSLIR